MPDSKPVFASPAASDKGGYAHDKENNPFLHFFHNVGKDVEDSGKYTFSLLHDISTAAGEQAVNKVIMAGGKLVVAATTAYAKRGADIEHDGEAWTALEDFIKAFEAFHNVVKSESPTPSTSTSTSYEYLNIVSKYIGQV